MANVTTCRVLTLLTERFQKYEERIHPGKLEVIHSIFIPVFRSHPEAEVQGEHGNQYPADYG